MRDAMCVLHSVAGSEFWLDNSAQNCRIRFHLAYLGQVEANSTVLGAVVKPKLRDCDTVENTHRTARTTKNALTLKALRLLPATVIRASEGVLYSVKEPLARGRGGYFYNH